MASKNNSFDSYIDQIGGIFNSLPALPKGGREFFVMILPWVALILGALGVLRTISSFGLFSYFSPYMALGGVDAVGRGMIIVILGLVSSVLLLMAFPGLNAKKSKGWKLIYYSEIVSLVSSIVIFSLGGILITLIGFYILYQVKSYYK